MASFEVIECNGVSKTNAGYCNGGTDPLAAFNFKQGENVEDVILHDMDSFLEDVEDRLTISRMVSDSVIKGIVTALSQEASDVIAAKEREVAGLGKVFSSRQCNYGEFNESEIEILGEIERAVFGTIVQGLCEEHDRRLWNVDNVLAFIDKCKGISSLRHELVSIQKSLVTPENGHLIPQVSLDADIFHRKVFNNHGLWDGNGKCEESEISTPENFEVSKLTHMTKPELYKHFTTQITDLKRAHESVVHQMTDENFSLKREYLKEREHLKERGPFAFRKDKEFESLKKKMSEAISKLDDILKENEKVSEFCNHSRDTLNSLLSENCRLRELLNEKKLETCYFSFEASDATEKLGQHLIAEKNLQRLIGDLSVSLEDARLEASTSEDVYKCILREIYQEKSDKEDSDLTSEMVQEIIGTIYEEAFHGANTGNESNNIETSHLMSDIMQQVDSIIFQEVVGDMSMEFNNLKNKYLNQGESLVYLETKVSKTEKDLYLEVEENGKLKHQVLVLKNIIEEKDKSLYEVTEELHKLMDLKKQQDILITDRDEELVLLQEKLEESRNYVDTYMSEVNKLNVELSVLESRLKKSDEKNNKLISDFEEQQNDLDYVKAKDREHMKQMESFCRVIDGLSKSIADLELRTNQSIGWQSSRLEHSAFQLHSFVSKVNILRRTGLLYKERMEKRCSDLQKAEAEVDVLGDEVDTLLRLLEKIYVALDHYSPILQHYPGIIEILKLVKREFSRSAAKGL